MPWSCHALEAPALVFVGIDHGYGKVFPSCRPWVFASRMRNRCIGWACQQAATGFNCITMALLNQQLEHSWELTARQRAKGLSDVC